tara:strand:- start:566 stop:793 length:228 start_codon:yes stop_codon:yes gene_type:complete
MELFVGFILHLYNSVTGQLLEFTPRDSLSECLKVKRVIERSDPPKENPRWVCKKGKLKLKKMGDGKYHPVEIIEE